MATRILRSTAPYRNHSVRASRHAFTPCSGPLCNLIDWNNAGQYVHGWFQPLSLMRKSDKNPLTIEGRQNVPIDHVSSYRLAWLRSLLVLQNLQRHLRQAFHASRPVIYCQLQIRQVSKTADTTYHLGSSKTDAPTYS